MAVGHVSPEFLAVDLMKLQSAALVHLLPPVFDVAERLQDLLMPLRVALAIDLSKLLCQPGQLLCDVVGRSQSTTLKVVGICQVLEFGHRKVFQLEHGKAKTLLEVHKLPDVADILGQDLREVVQH